MSAPAPERLLRGWLESASAGALSTLSAAQEHAGWPYGTLVPYALDAEGRPLLLLATIAEHTQNLRRDARASLLVHEPAALATADPQTGWRLTLIGRMRRLEATGTGDAGSLGLAVPADALTALRSHYEASVAGAAASRGLPGFDLWRLDVTRVRYIAGFGQMGWAGADALRG